MDLLGGGICMFTRSGGDLSNWPKLMRVKSDGDAQTRRLFGGCRRDPWSAGGPRHRLAGRFLNPDPFREIELFCVRSTEQQLRPDLRIFVFVYISPAWSCCSKYKFDSPPETNPTRHLEKPLCVFVCVTAHLLPLYQQWITGVRASFKLSRSINTSAIDPPPPTPSHPNG